MYNKSVNNKFCILPWISLSIGTDGQIHPCCQVVPFENPDNIRDYQGDEYQNTPNLKRLRKQFMEGECPSECSQCFVQEDQGAVSMRMIKNNTWKELIEERKFDQDPKSLIEFDIRFSNICQLSCLTCEPLFSTSWYQYEKDNPISKEKKVLRSFENVESIDQFVKDHGADLRLLTVSGGEPLLEPLALEFFQRIDNQNIELNLNTSLMLPESVLQKNLNELKKFKNIKLAISLDGIAEHAETIRRGLDWKLFLSNLKLLKKEIGEEYLYFQITCSSLNAGSICEVLNWIHTEHRSLLTRTLVNFVHSPQKYNSQLASPIQKEEWMKSNHSLLKSKLFQNLNDDEYRHILKLLAQVSTFLQSAP